MSRSFRFTVAREEKAAQRFWVLAAVLLVVLCGSRAAAMRADSYTGRVAHPPTLSDALNPAASLRTSRWWLTAVPVAVVVAIAALVSSMVAVPGAPVSPIYLPLGIGVAVLAVWGRSLWPAFLVGDAIGMTIVADRGAIAVLVALGLHVVVLLLGATLIRRWDAWLIDLGSVGRFLVIAVGLAAFGALTGLLVLSLQPIDHGRYGLFGDFLTWMMGDLSGYVVGGALVIAWADRERARLAARRAEVVAIAIVTALGAWMLLQPTTFTAAVALAALGVVAMRFGVLAGTLASALLLGVLLDNSVRGFSTFGGETTQANAFYAMLALVISSSAALLLAGYRDGVGEVETPRRTVTLVVAGTFVVAGVAGFATSSLMAGRGYPLATASIFSFASALALAMVRGARRPDRRMTHDGLRMAAMAGTIVALSLALYYASLPYLGVGAGTGLSMTAPGFVVLIVAVTIRRVPPPLVLVGAAAITVGAAAIAHASGVGDPTGIAVALLGGFTFALFITMLARALRYGSPTEVALVVMLCASITTAVLALITEGVGAFAITPRTLAVIAFGAIGSSAIPTLARAWSLPATGASVVGALGVLAPVTTVALSMALLGTGRSTLAIIGLAVITTGAVITALAPRFALYRRP